MIIYLKKSFSSAHFYTQKNWSEEKNLETFGRCHTQFGHGHNYTLEVGFHTAPSMITSDRKTCGEILNVLTHRLDHEHLNFVIPEFRDKVLPPEKIYSVKLNEMEDLWTEIRA